MRYLLLALLLASTIGPAMTASAQDVPLSLVAVSRAGDRVQVSMRANDGLSDVVVQLLSGTSIAALPDWERNTWRSGDVHAWNFTLLKDVESVTISWAADDDGDRATGTIDVILPPSSFDEPISLVDVARSGDAVVVTTRANEDLADVVARLTQDGAIVGLPEQREESWDDGERREWSFSLLQEVSQATLQWQAEDAGGALRTGSLAITVPAATAGAQPRLVITSATLTGANATITLSNYGDASARNVVVSIEDEEQRRIGAPLTQLFASLAPGARGVAEFQLLADLTDVVVAVDHANATTRTAVALRKVDGNGSVGVGGVNVTMSTDLPFREVDLGRSADYAVQVKNNGAPSLVQLRVDGLPQGYSARFFVGGSAVPSLYLDRNQTRQATLTITVPSARTEVDRTVDFTVVSSVNGTEAGRLAMGVAVRGVGTLEVSSPDGVASIPAGGQATFQVTIKNDGSAPVFNVEIDSRRPYGWTVRVEPRRVDRIDPGSSAAVSVEVRAPDVLGGGAYSVDVAAKAGDTTSRYIPLELSVSEAETSGGWIWGVMLVLIAGILGFGAWWKWKR